MSKLCQNCCQSYDDNLELCPFCSADQVKQPVEEPNKTIFEEVQATNVEPLAPELPPELPPQEVSTEIPSQPVVEENVESTPEPTKSSPVEKSDTVISSVNIAEKSEGLFEEIAVDNANLETIVVNESNIELVEEEQKIEMPEIPEPAIGEISIDTLSNSYEESERINNERRLEKQRIEAEQERIRQEEANQRAQTPVARPDLLAGANLNGENNSEEIINLKQSKITKKKLIIGASILLVIILAVVILIFINK